MWKMDVRMIVCLPQNKQNTALHCATPLSFGNSKVIINCQDQLLTHTLENREFIDKQRALGENAKRKKDNKKQYH